MSLALGPALAMAVCATMCGWEWRKIALGRASLGWSRTEGFVTDARFSEATHHIDSDKDDVAYAAHLTYAYTVRGRRYRTKRFTYRPTRGLGQGAAYALLRGVCRGDTIAVYYDPRRPHRAVAFPGIDNGNLFALGVWVCAASVAGWWLASG